MKKASLAGLVLTLLAPFVAFAQTAAPLGNIEVLVVQLGNIVRLFIPILIAVAVIMFFWGLVKYIRDSGKGHTEGRNIMIAGLASLFVMITLFGVLQFIGNALGVGGAVNSGSPLNPPHVSN